MNKNKGSDDIQKPRISQLFRILLIIISCILALGLILSAYGGYISPSRFKWAGLITMSFPIWLIIIVLWTSSVSFFSFKSVIPCIAGLLLTIGPILDYCPLNISNGGSTPGNLENTFSLLTYNVYGFADKDSVYLDDYNVTLSYILSSGADIIALQEAGLPVYVNSRLHISQQQADSVKEIYPYRASLRSTSVLSKYPFEQVDIARDSILDDSVIVCDFVIAGKKIRLYNMHLASFKLTDEDKELYREITHLDAGGKREEVKDMILNKLVVANSIRARQARALSRIMTENPEHNVIVCGDFNDVPNSYTVRKLEKLGFKQFYPQVGFGPLITYYRDRLYFRIDHILYKGKIRPLSLVREKIRTSDHYPQLVRFAVD